MNRSVLTAALSVVLAGALAAPAATTARETPADADAAPADPAGLLGTTDGGEIYTRVCQSCHMSEGRGAEGGGAYPAFAGNPRLASKDYVAVTILHGRRNMPSFADDRDQSFFFEQTWLTDDQVAAVTNHLRTHFGNHYEDAITAEDVAALHHPGD